MPRKFSPNCKACLRTGRDLMDSKTGGTYRFGGSSSTIGLSSKSAECFYLNRLSRSLCRVRDWDAKY